MPAEVGWGKAYHFPRAIVHVDGDGFFAACEVARNPALRGKPVVTGAERGIVSAATYEAKARGVKRGVRLADVKKICPEAIILSSDYELYTLYSLRMYEIMRRYTPIVEEYGIDECFGDITGLRRTFHMGYEDIARKIKEDLVRELDISFSLGLSSTKVLAKIGSKYQKPNGFTAIPLIGKDTYLRNTDIQGVWGIGPNTAELLRKHGVTTAFDFAHKSEAWVEARLTKPGWEIWKELNGDQMYELETEKKESYHSIQKTKTFSPHTKDIGRVYSELSKNLEAACKKVREYNLKAQTLSFFIKSDSFRYKGAEIRLSSPTNTPTALLSLLKSELPKVYEKSVYYRATGVTLGKLVTGEETQLDLFSNAQQLEGTARIFEAVDSLNERFGKHAVYLGTSMKAIDASKQARKGKGIGSESFTRQGALFLGKDRRKILSLPYLGEV